MRIRLAILAAGALTLASCATRPSPAPAPTREVRKPPSRPAARAPTAAVYLATAASLDLYEIQSSELALTRGQSLRVKEFAQMMIAAHRGTASQLSMAGRRLNLLPAAALQPGEQALIAELQSAPDFDAAYKRQQRAAHAAADRLHYLYATKGGSPTLRPVAKNALDVVRRHRALLKQL